MHLLIEIGNNFFEGLVDTRASMSMMFAMLVQELGIMHLVTKSKSYKTASKVVIQTLSKILKLPMKVGDV
jgi:hypothetical protein